MVSWWMDWLHTMRKHRHRPTGTTLLVPFLAATLALAVWLGVHAVQGVRSHRDTAEAALRDYARTATWESSRVARDRLDSFLDDLFDDAYPRLRRGRSASIETVRREIDDALEEQGCACRLLLESALFFEANLRTGEITSEPQALEPDRGEQLNALLAAVAPEDRRAMSGLVTAAPGMLLDEAAAVVFIVGYGIDERPLSGLGMLVRADAFGELFALWFREHPLLPPAITGNLPNDSLIRLAVHTPDGTAILEPQAPFTSAFSARDTLESGLGSLVVAAAVRPEAAPRLIIGGLPGSNLPVILGLLLLTLGVGAAALLQIRRERQLAAMRNDFISGVSHELRTPLAQIRVFAELEESGKLRSVDERRRAMMVINREATRLSHLVDNVLRFSRQHRGPPPKRASEEVDIHDAVHEAAEAMHPLASLQRMSIAAESQKGIRALAGRDGVRQILVNLLDNAVKYGPPGQRIDLRAWRDRERVIISVEDQGPGIPEAERRKVFEPYRRLARDVEARHPGTGIGLAVVTDLVSLYDGTVHIEDGAVGARFVVTLPAAGPAGLSSEAPAAHEVTA